MGPTFCCTLPSSTFCQFVEVKLFKYQSECEKPILNFYFSILEFTLKLWQKFIFYLFITKTERNPCPLGGQLCLSCVVALATPMALMIQNAILDFKISSDY